MRNLKRELIRAKEELKKIQSVPLVIGQVRKVAVCSLATSLSRCSVAHAPLLSTHIDVLTLCPRTHRQNTTFSSTR